MTIAAVTINLIVAAAIVLLNLHNLIDSNSCFPNSFLSIHFQGVAEATCVEACGSSSRGWTEPKKAICSGVKNACV